MSGPNLLRFALPPLEGLEGLVEETEALRAVLTDLLATPVDVTVSRSDDELARNLESGAVDFGHAPSLVCARVEAAGLSVVARAVRHGRAAVAAALLCRRGSGVSLARPKQIRATWTREGSLTGHLLPVAHLKSTRRLHVERHFASQRFAGGTAAALVALFEKNADLVAVPVVKNRPESVREFVERHAPGRGDDVEVLEMTAEVATDGVAVGTRHDGDAIRAAFLHLSSDPAGQKVLERIFDAERFAESPAGAYRALRSLLSDDA